MSGILCTCTRCNQEYTGLLVHHVRTCNHNRSHIRPLQSRVSRIFNFMRRTLSVAADDSMVSNTKEMPTLPPSSQPATTLLNSEITMSDDISKDGLSFDIEEELLREQEPEKDQDKDQSVEEQQCDKDRSRQVTNPHQFFATHPFPLLIIESCSDNSRIEVGDNATNINTPATKLPANIYDRFVPSTCPPDTIDGDPILSRYSLCINKRFKILICLSCRILVKPCDIRGHLSRIHSVKKLPADFGVKLKETYSLCESVPIITSKIPPVFGLTTMRHMQICCKCHCGYSSNNSFIAHLHNDHDGHRHKFYLSPAQRFTSCKNGSYFPVDISTSQSPPSPSSDLERLLSKDKDIDISSEPMTFTPDPHLLSRFLIKSRWTEVVEGLVPKFVQQYVGPPTDDEDSLKIISGFTKQWLEEGQALIRKQPYTLLQSFSRYTSDGPESPVSRFNAVEPNTVKRYASTINLVILFVIRVFCATPLQDNIAYPAPMSPQQKEAVNMLLKALPSLDAVTIVPHIQNVVLSLFKHQMEDPTSDHLFSCVTHFIILSSVMENGSFKAASQITPLLAILTHCGRVSLLGHHSALKAGSDARLPWHAFEAIKPYLIREASTPLAYIFECWTLIKTIASAEQGIPNVSSSDASGRDVIYLGNIFTIKDINSMVHGLINSWDQMLQDDIFQECRSPFLEVHIPPILVDDPRNVDPGFCFLDLPANNLACYQNVLVQHYLEHPNLTNMFFYRNGEDVVPIRTELEEVLKAESRMTEIMMVLISITSGSPARAIEMVTHLLRNIPGGSIRNLFCLFNLVLVIGGYSKTSSTTLKDKVIPRVAPPAIMNRFLYQLIVIRPAMERFARICRDAEAASRYRHFLYPGLDRARTSAEFSHILSQHTRCYLPAALHIRDWRQVAVGFSRFNQNLLDIKSAAQTKFSTYQMGHSEETEDRHYAITPDMLLSISHQRLLGCISISGAWHTLFDLGDDISRAISTINSKSTPLSISGIGHSSPDALSSGLNNVDIPELSRIVAEHLQDNISREIRLNLAHAAAVYWPEPPLSNRQDYNRSLLTPPERLRSLRAFFKDPSARFRDEKQAYALELIIQREQNLLLVFPTGYGKTMLFLLPVKIYDQGLTTVVIVPLVALLENLIARASADKIESQCWTAQQNNPKSALIFVSVEAAATTKFRQWIHGLCTERRLARLVVDEAHRAVVDVIYREVFKFLHEIRISANVPLICLTATIPFPCEVMLMKTLGCSIFETIRVSTNRPNIAYSFVPTRQDDYHNKIAAYLLDRIRVSDISYRALIFCRTKYRSHGGVEPLADFLGKYFGQHGLRQDISCYYSDKEGKGEEYRKWECGETKVMVATTALGAGIHIASIRDIIHCGLSSSVIEYSQETGRGGRDGCECRAITFFDLNDTFKPPLAAEDYFGARLLQQVASNKSKCRRFDMTDLLDGTPTDCVACGGSLCDSCSYRYDILERGLIRVNELRLSFIKPPETTTLPEPTFSTAARDPVATFSVPSSPLFTPGPTFPDPEPTCLDQVHPGGLTLLRHKRMVNSPQANYTRSGTLRLSEEVSSKLMSSPIVPMDMASSSSTCQATPAAIPCHSQCDDLADRPPSSSLFHNSHQPPILPRIPDSPSPPRKSHPLPPSDVGFAVQLDFARERIKKIKDHQAYINSSSSASRSVTRNPPARRTMIMDLTNDNISQYADNLPAAVQKFLDLLHELKGKCSPCWLIGMNHNHELDNCTGRRANKDDNSYKKFRGMLKLETKTCFKCLGSQRAGYHIWCANPRDCELGDIAKPLLYLIASMASLCERFKERGPHSQWSADVEFSLSDYLKWLPITDKDGITNIVRTIAWLVDVRNSGLVMAV